METMERARETEGMNEDYDREVTMAVNVAGLAHLDEETREQITWLHQHTLERGLTWGDLRRGLGHDRTTLGRVLRGTYEHSYEQVMASIAAYRKIAEEREGTQRNEFVETPLTKAIFTALDYTLGNGSITMIVGPSRRGKTTAIREWRRRNNHGRSVLIDAPAYGGPKALIREIAGAVGVNMGRPGMLMLSGVQRAFSRDRILIVDEAGRLAPNESRGNPVALEVVRDLHDRTGCAVALVSTSRLESELRAGEYQYEQLLGRIGLPIKLPLKMREAHWLPILKQYVRTPSAKVMEAAGQIANDRGSLGVLVETLKVASRIATKEGKPLGEAHFFRSLAIRKSMSGGDE